MDSTVTGVPLEYVMEEFKDGAWSTSDKVSASISLVSDPKMVWSFNSGNLLTAGSYLHRFYFNNGFLAASSEDTAVPFTLIVSDSACQEPWTTSTIDHSVTLSSSSSGISHLHIEIEETEEAYPLSPAPPATTVSIDPSLQVEVVTMGSMNEVIQLAIELTGSSYFGEEKLVLLEVGPNCFEQTLSVTVAVDVQFC
mmetsp:Transcript_23513/g.36199  ORF Transcript_23513/g.36199 Transcript_23513/m.36199 type:complete len:196 (+) Transcript_23513:3-590(+)